MTDVSNPQAVPPHVQEILRKYRLIGPDGQPTQTIIKTSTDGHPAGGQGQGPLGAGPLLDPAVIQRFLAADTTPNKAWFDWMLFHAAGGRDAQKRGELLMAKIKDRFFKERLSGVNRNGKQLPPVSRPEAERLWKKNEKDFTETVVIGDQDLADRPHEVFGFYRHWPGKNRIYERVAEAVSTFLSLARKAKEMNKHFQHEGNDDKMVAFDPGSYQTVDSLIAATKSIQRFHASKKARVDVRVQTIYDDDYVTALCPLTYAAAVRYGWDEWAWANRGQFETTMRGEGNSNWNHPWKNSTGRDNGVFVYIQFKVPMPSWVAYSGDKFKRHTLYNLALNIPATALRSFDEDSIKLFDEENRTNLTLDHIKEQIRAEATRDYNPDNEEYPISQGPRVYGNEQEAEEVVRHLEAAMGAIKQWAAAFDPKQVVSDFLPNE